MAKKIDDNTVEVERGDTLWGIAKTYLGSGTSYTQLANINNISNPNLIYVGQIIKLSPTEPSKPSSSTSQPSISAPPQSKPIITAFGIQSNTDNTLFAVWDWGRENTEKYEVEWYYTTGDKANGSLIWFTGSKSSTEDRQSTYSIPTNATQVKFRCKAVSKTYTVNSEQVSYWTGEWSVNKIHDTKDNPPKKPATPSVEVENYTLTASLTNLDVNANQIRFQVIINDNSVYKLGTVNISSTNTASFQCTISAGDKFKVRCQSCKDGKYSDWSDYSSNFTSVPAAPGSITECRATSSTSIYLAWSAAKAATSYEIQYATNKDYFDGTDKVTTKTGIEFTHYELIGIETGQEYFFRVRASNDKGKSAWTAIKSVIIGKPPSAPTTWSSTTTVITGETLNLYWVHNSNDSSSQTYAELEIYFDGVKETHIIKNTESEDDKDKTSVYSINTESYNEGTTISWRVRTAGVTLTYGDWSAQRVVNVYAPPTLQLEMFDVNHTAFETLTSFPFYISALAGPNTQAPIGYHVSVRANESYETVDSVGNVKMVNEGDEIYSKHFDIKTELMVEFSANNIDLENNISYTISCIVSMNSGLTAESSLDFDVMWSDEGYDPNAEITADMDTLVTYIRPYCEDIKWTYYKVEYVNGEYVKTSEVLEEMIGMPYEEVPTVSVYTTTEDEVFFGKTSANVEVFFCVVPTKYLVEGVKLAVYRREFDGTYTEIEKNIANDRNTFVTDPHPSLDLARYRIVATTVDTGAVSYTDLAGYPIGEKSVVIQWDEEWTMFETSNEDEMEKPPWSGSLLKLPYNINVSNKYGVDKSLISYVGRKHPVSYYGTQLGESASWSLVIPKSDKETLYAIRRLSIWTDDVYVREPSGTGYWASISVSYNINHKETTIPISFEITRVEGGM